MPGHTSGHHGLLVKLREMGPVLIAGDLAHVRENYESDGVPTFNTDRAASLASIDRFPRIAKNRKATVIIQHDRPVSSQATPPRGPRAVRATSRWAASGRSDSSRLSSRGTAIRSWCAGITTAPGSLM
ncbi:hypothetical protein [Gemmatimonas sp.]|uniref:hypothetical protein n=1 Tax=Gemmatimonas sp. TaxID=1962908 RepID=UPI00286CD022|nr:hypothetical protein [Gemmatimonas sp.]